MIDWFINALAWYFTPWWEGTLISIIIWWGMVIWKLLFRWFLLSWVVDNIKKLPPPARTLAEIAVFPFVAVFYTADVLVNLFPLSVRLWEWPQELTITSRFSRHLMTPGKNWRKDYAIKWCDRLEKAPGQKKHCGEREE